MRVCGSLPPGSPDSRLLPFDPFAALFIAGKSTGSQTRPQGLHGEARSVGKIPTGKEARLSPRSMPVMPALGVRFGFVSPVGGSLK
jgi:hypothetical protein